SGPVAPLNAVTCGRTSAPASARSGFRACHCAESKLVFTRSSAEEPAGATAAPPSGPAGVRAFPQAESSSATASRGRTRRTAAMLLAPRPAAHQRGDQLVQALAFEDAAHALGD